MAESKPHSCRKTTLDMFLALQGVLTYATKTHYRFDKRDYSWHYPPLDLPMPPENVNVPSLRKLIACINEVSAATPGWAAHANAHEQA